MPPFEYSAPQNRFGATIADLMAHKNDAYAQQAQFDARLRSQTALQNAQLLGDTVRGIGNTIAAIPQQRYARDVQQAQAARQMAETEHVQAQTRGLTDKQAEEQRARMARGEIGKLVASTPMSENGLYDIDAIAAKLPPEYALDAEPHLKQLASINQALDQENQRRAGQVTKVAQAFLQSGAWNDPLSVDGVIATAANDHVITRDQAAALRRVAAEEGGGQKVMQMLAGPQKLEKLGKDDRLVNPQTNQVVVDAIPPPKKTTVINGQLVDDATGERIGEPVAPQETSAQVETARHNQEMERIAGLTAGRQAAMDEETKRHNRASEENARNAKTARPVTSGDAGRFAELQTSLDDLDKLANVLGTTGAASKVGAMLPNAVTEATGWGADAKARQATIDRVKQVIGKALEGGVLRKEDELKYQAILPTIGDPPSVAKSKLNGLRAAIQQRLSREIDAREDAGYDVSKFKERGGQTTAPAAPATGRQRVKGPDGQTGTVPRGAPLPAGWTRLD